MATYTFKGGDKLKKRLEELSKKANKAALVSVGFFQGSNEPNGASTPMIAAIQEFGAPAKGIPPRPFFRNMIAKEEVHWGDDLAAALKASEYDANKALDLMGESIDGELRQSISTITEPPLSKVTVLLRQRFGNNPQEIKFADVQQARADIAAGVEPDANDKPLVWTGSLLNSVHHKVE